MTNLLWNAYFWLKSLGDSLLKDEDGEANIIAIILIIIVVIALAVIFRNQLIDIVNRLFGRINEDIDAF